MKSLKGRVHDYWNKQSCGTIRTNQDKYSKEYFEEIENYRYMVEPEIFSFAQFTRFHGKKILEVGIGAGTDFIQWVRAGAYAYGIDLTEEAIENVKHRLSVYDLKAKEIRVADSEALPYETNCFDLVYSWGVIHHTPETERALNEIIRVARPGGICKIMLYNRHSLNAIFLWGRKALLKGRPWKNFSWCLYHHMESEGTKAFTRREVLQMLKHVPVANVKISTVFSWSDKLKKYNRFFQFLARLLAICLGWDKMGWFMTIQFEKVKEK